jgi:hypothetical protein
LGGARSSQPVLGSRLNPPDLSREIADGSNPAAQAFTIVAMLAAPTVAS